MADLAKVLKRRYFGGTIPDATLQNFPFLAMISKDNDFSGDYLTVPIKYAKTTRSRTFVQAQANTANMKMERWLIDVVPDYVDQQIPREAVLRTKDKGSFVKMFADVIDDAISVLDENTAGSLYRDSGGAHGQLDAASGVASPHIHFMDISQEVMFEEGQVVRLSAAADGTGVVAGSGTLGRVDRDLGTLTTANGLNWNNVANIPTAANAMYIYIDGDQTLSISGLPSWLLADAPTPAAKFFDVDRIVDTRLYGTYFDGTGLAPEEAVKRGLMRAVSRGGRPTKVFMAPTDFADIEISLLNSNLLKRVVTKTEDGKYGFDGIEISHGNGSATVLSDPKCVPGTAWGLQMDTWKLTYMGPKVGSTIIDDDGQLIRTYNADSFDIRCGNWSQLYCTKPGNNARIKLY